MNAPSYFDTAIPDGPRVLSQPMAHTQSVALGLMVNTGSRDESPEQAGIAHALEHMVFKGTNKLNVDQLCQQLDQLGGTANAFTSHERTCFHMRVLHEDWQQALDILMDMLLEPALPEAEWLREREVIFSEMSMVDDAPDEWAYERHMGALFPDHNLGRPTLGSRESLSAFSAETLRGFLQQRYRPPRLQVMASGRIDHQQLCDAVAGRIWPQGGAQAERSIGTMIAGTVNRFPREIEQAHIIATFPGMASANASRPQAWLANQLLGGGMSSLLFREVREKRGLAYSVGSHLSTYQQQGLWSISCGTEPAMLEQCRDVIVESLAAFCHAIDPAALDRAKRQMEVQLRMAMDSVDGRMMALSSRFNEEVITDPLEWAARIRATTLESVQAWACDHLQQPAAWSFCASDGALSAIR
ncbi:MAG: pitrilysin family protein [Mariprofundales bacterium]